MKTKSLFAVIAISIASCAVSAQEAIPAKSNATSDTSKVKTEIKMYNNQLPDLNTRFGSDKLALGSEITYTRYTGWYVQVAGGYALENSFCFAVESGVELEHLRGGAEINYGFRTYMGNDYNGLGLTLKGYWDILKFKNKTYTSSSTKGKSATYRDLLPIRPYIGALVGFDFFENDGEDMYVASNSKRFGWIVGANFKLGSFNAYKTKDGIKGKYRLEGFVEYQGAFTSPGVKYNPTEVLTHQIMVGISIKGM